MSTLSIYCHCIERKYPDSGFKLLFTKSKVIKTYIWQWTPLKWNVNHITAGIWVNNDMNKSKVLSPMASNNKQINCKCNCIHFFFGFEMKRVDCFWHVLHTHRRNSMRKGMKPKINGMANVLIAFQSSDCYVNDKASFMVLTLKIAKSHIDRLHLNQTYKRKFLWVSDCDDEIKQFFDDWRFLMKRTSMKQWLLLKTERK